MNGPCLCGDPSCRRCFPGSWRWERARGELEDRHVEEEHEKKILREIVAYYVPRGQPIDVDDLEWYDKVCRGERDCSFCEQIIESSSERDD